MFKYTRQQMLDSIHKRIRLDGLRATCRQVGVDSGYLSRALAGKAPFSDEAAAKFGYERQEAQYIHRKST
jgi:hypothetical protein